MREIRILLVGDDGVGKSTLITSLIKDTFVSNIPHVVPEVTIPPEWTREKVTTRIVDSSSRSEMKDSLEVEIRKANVICIVYAIDIPESYDRISTHWLPYLRRLGRNVPVVLVGNKIDCRGKDITNDALDEQIMPIMNEFKEVETCVECSAKQSLNVSEVFYFAQKAVLYPSAPLYDSREHALKPACIDALRRIFRLSDTNKDGYLDDEEINEFQVKCFGAPLQKHELESVKQIVQENEPEGHVEQGLTEIGFLFLHTMFIQRGRLETTWTMLRTFGYGDDLSLRENYLYPHLDLSSGYSVELSSSGYKFFIELFTAFDRDKDGALRDTELDELFSTSPGNPWEAIGFPETTVTNDAGALTLQGFLAQWSMTTLLDYKTTLAYLAYLGYPDEDTTKALKVVKSRKPNRRNEKHQKSVFSCFVFGAAGSGKTSLMRGFVKKEFRPTYTPTSRDYMAVNSIEYGGVEKYLVLQEISPTVDAEVLQNKKKLESSDLLCFVYDSADANSFAYVANLLEKYPVHHLPVVFVATKSDLDLVTQRHPVQPDAFCRNLGLSVPISVSMKEKVTADLFNMLIGVAMEPSVAIPRTHLRGQNAVQYMAVAAVSVAVIGVAASIWYRYGGRASQGG